MTSLKFIRLTPENQELFRSRPSGFSTGTGLMALVDMQLIDNIVHYIQAIINHYDMVIGPNSISSNESQFPLTMRLMLIPMWSLRAVQDHLQGLRWSQVTCGAFGRMMIADSAANENPRMKLNGTNLGYSKHYVLTFQSPNER